MATLVDDQPVIVVSRTIIVTPEDPDSDATIHQWANARFLTFTSDGYHFKFQRVSNSAFTAPEDPIPLFPLDGLRSAWFRYDATADGAMPISAEGETAPIKVKIFEVTNGTWTQLVDQTASNAYSGTVPIYAGRSYYVRVSNAGSDNGVQYYQLSGRVYGIANLASAPPAGVTVTISAPVVKEFKAAAVPITLIVGTPAPVPGGSRHADAPPIGIDVGTGKPSIVRPPLAVPPIQPRIRVVEPLVARFRYGQIEPDDDIVLPVNAPNLSAYAYLYEGDVDEPGTIEMDFEYGSLAGSSYTVLGTLRQPVEIYTSYTHIDQALPELPGGDYQWRVRIVVDGDPRPWTSFWQFGIGTTVNAAAVLPVLSHIIAGSPRPHLWFIDPPVGAPGDKVTIVGHGFPLAQTSVYFGTDQLDVVSWTHRSATGNATTADRLIDPDSVVDCEHDEVVVTVPDTDEPGGSVTIMGV